MTDRRVLGMSANLYRAHDHLARVHSDPRLDGNPALGTQTVGIATQLLLHRQRGMKGTLRMVLVRDGRAEQSEDAVARRLRDVAAVAMHRRHHKLQHRVDDRARLFGSRSRSSSVEPLISANSAVTVLRSPSSASEASACAEV